MPVVNYEIRFYKSGDRIQPTRFTGSELRFFFKEMFRLAKYMGYHYKNKIDDASILIIHDDEEIYRTRERLSDNNIDTVDDVIYYLEAEDTIYSLVDNEFITDKTKKISRATVIELYSDKKYMSFEQLNKLGRMIV